ncbi:hypothetical protein AB3N58_15695 [Leptospira sp. WS60.C2]
MKVNTRINRFAVLLLSLVFLITSTEASASLHESISADTTYNQSSLYEFSHVLQSVSENNEEESEIDSQRILVLFSSISLYSNFFISFSSELISISFVSPFSISFLNHLHDRAPPFTV